MKIPLAALAVMLLGLGVAHAQTGAPAKPDEAREKALIASERALQEAVVTADKASFESLVLSSTAFWTTKHGFILMRQLADSLDQFKITKWELLNPRVTWLNESAAIVSYTWSGVGTLFGEPLPPMALAMTVWTERAGKWLAVTHQETDLLDAGARR